MRCGIEIEKQEGEKREKEGSIRKNAQENEMRCFEYEGVGHQ